MQHVLLVATATSLSTSPEERVLTKRKLNAKSYPTSLTITSSNNHKQYKLPEHIQPAQQHRRVVSNIETEATTFRQPNRPYHERREKYHHSLSVTADLT